MKKEKVTKLELKKKENGIWVSVILMDFKDMKFWIKERLLSLKNNYKIETNLIELSTV